MALEKFEHRITTTWVGGSGSVTASETIEGGGEDNRNVELLGSAMDVEVDLEFAYSRLKSFFIVADQAVTLETNSSSAAIDTIALGAGVPMVWTSASGIDNPFTADVTKIFLTNDADDVAIVQMRVLVDPLP